MADSVSELEQLRDAVTSYVESLEDFAGVKVLSRKTGDLQNKIERNLASIGVGVIVMLPQAIPHLRMSKRPVLDPVHLRLRCFEDKLINKTGKSAAYLAERGLAALSWWAPLSVPGSFMIEPVEPGILELNLIGKPGEDTPEDLAGFDVFFKTKLALQPAS